MGLSWPGLLTNGTVQLGFVGDIRDTLNPAFQYPGNAFTHSAGIDSSGQVIGSFIDFSNGDWGVFLRSPDGTFTRVASPNGMAMSGEAISSNGSIALSGLTSIYIKVGDTYKTITVPGAGRSLNATNVTGIDDVGHMVGFYYPDFAAAQSFYLDTQGVFSQIYVPGSVYTEVEGMNNRGQAVGFYYDSLVDHGFLWNNGITMTIDFPGAQDSFAYGINDQGVIVGSYGDGNTYSEHGFIASPVPEPRSIGIVGAGFLFLFIVPVTRRKSIQ